MYVEGLGDKRSYPGTVGQEGFSRSQEYTELYQVEQAQAVGGELSILLCSCCVQDENWPETDKAGERLSEGPCAGLRNVDFFSKVTKEKQDFPTRKVM